MNRGPGDEIFQLWESIPCLLMHWLLIVAAAALAPNSCPCISRHGTGCAGQTCSKANFINLGQTKSKWVINSLRPRQNRRHFADNVFKCNFLYENVWIPIKISLKFVPKGPINNIPAMVQIMAWRRPDNKPLSEPMMVSLLTHICVARPQWVNYNCLSQTANSKVHVNHLSHD